MLLFAMEEKANFSNSNLTSQRLPHYYSEVLVADGTHVHPDIQLDSAYLTVHVSLSLSCSSS